LAHLPTTVNAAANTADPDSYEKWYERRTIALYYLMGAAATAGALHFVAKFHYANVEIFDLIGRSIPGWEAARTVESVTAYLSFFLPACAGREAGYGARKLEVLRTLTLAPTYMSHLTWLVLARDLYPERLPGDEPEELEVVPWRLDALHELILREDFSEGRSIAALFLAREHLRYHAPTP
jgi:hypothetical protein